MPFTRTCSAQMLNAQLHRAPSAGQVLPERHALRQTYAVGLNTLQSSGCRRRWLGSARLVAPITCRAATGSPAAPKRAAGRSGGARKAASGAPLLPWPMDYQQTLRKSFTVGGIGLHTGEYAYVRVKPACPGEGRYFVRVAEGTNSSLFQVDTPQRATKQEVAVQFPTDDLSEDVRAGLFLEFLRAQEESNYEGDFYQFLNDLEEAEAAEDLVEAQRVQEDEEAVPRAEGPGQYIPAAVEAVTREHPWATVLGEGDNSILGAELLLAALEQCGVDDARIEIEGGSEVPIIDGSGQGWVVEIQRVGLRRAGAAPGEGPDEGTKWERLAPAPQQPILVQDGDSFVAFYPGLTTKLSVGVDAAEVAPVVGRQWFSWSPEWDEHFRWEVAPARTTFTSIEEVTALCQRGELRGGPDYVSLIPDGDEWHDENELRFAGDEAARHAMLDLLGNLSLAARPGHRGLPVGHIVAFNASNDLQIRFAREVAAAAAGGEEGGCRQLAVGSEPLEIKRMAWEAGEEAVPRWRRTGQEEFK